VELHWPIRSVCAGTVGTATMTLAYAGERRLRRARSGPLDYDNSLVPGQIVAAVAAVGDQILRRST
jgi:hypothetical protein